MLGSPGRRLAECMVLLGADSRVYMELWLARVFGYKRRVYSAVHLYNSVKQDCAVRLIITSSPGTSR